MFHVRERGSPTTRATAVSAEHWAVAFTKFLGKTD